MILHSNFLGKETYDSATILAKAANVIVEMFSGRIIEQKTRYTLVKILGVGSRSIVHLCYLGKDDKHLLVIKSIPLVLDVEERRKAVFMLDGYVKPIMQVRHRNIVEHYGSFYEEPESKVDAPAYKIFMEYCTGGTLMQMLFKFPEGLPVEKIRNYSKQILEGLHYLHNRNQDPNRKPITHRNLSGSNILFSENEVVKIGGLATGRQLEDHMTKAREVSHSRGSTTHMSPEMLLAYTQPGMNIGRRTDVWSLGCVVLEMLTGKGPQFINDGKPMAGSYPQMSFVANGGLPYIPPAPKTSPALKEFLSGCFVTDPSKRMWTEELLATKFITNSA